MIKIESLILNKMKHFAYNFTPTFQCSTLLNLCNFPTERTEIGYVLNYWPFLKYKSWTKSNKNSPTKSSSSSCAAALPSTSLGSGSAGIELRREDKEMIRNELTSQFASGSLKFDDQNVMSKLCENLSKPDGFQPDMDEDSNEVKVISNIIIFILLFPD